MRAHGGVVAQELLQAVAERMDVPQGELVLVAVTYNGGIFNFLTKQLQYILTLHWKKIFHMKNSYNILITHNVFNRVFCLLRYIY